MKIVRKIWRFLVLLIIIIVVAMVLVPYIYKDEIMASLKDAVNENINAKVDFEDIDISLFKSFPKVALDIQKPKVVGIEDFENVLLFKSDYIRVNSDLTSVFKSDQPIKIQSVEIDNADINVVVLSNGKANYDIIPPSESTSETPEFILELDHYSITNSDITYNDKSASTSVEILDINHEGSGNFTADKYDLITNTKVDKLSANSGGIGYLNNVKVSADNKISVDAKESKYTISENVVSLNSLNLKTDGFVKMNGEDMIVNLELAAPQSDFKDFISLVPNAYKGDLNKVESRGKADVRATVNGTYNGDKGRMPNYEVAIKVADGYVKYPGLPKAIENVQMDVNVKSKGKDMIVNIPSFEIKSGINSLQGDLSYETTSNNPAIVANLDGSFDFNDLSNSFPIEGMNEVNGKMQFEKLYVDATLDNIKNEKFDKVNFSGKVNVQDVNLDFKESPDVKMDKFYVEADPKKVVITDSDLNIGKSDLVFSGELNNPLAYFLPESKIDGTINIDAGKIDLNEWVGDEEEVAEMMTLSTDLERLSRASSVNVNATAKEISYYNYKIKNNVFKGAVGGEMIDVQKYNGVIYDNEFEVQGKLNGLYDYIFNNQILNGELNFSSDKFNTNPFLEKTEEPEVLEPFRVPLNMDIVINTDLKDVQYSKLKIEKMNGAITMSKGIMEFREVLTQALGGDMNFEGVYNSIEEQPLFSLKYNMSKVKFSETFKSFGSVQKVAPILEYIDGIFNSTLIMEARLTKDMLPDFSTMTAQGFLETISGKLNEIEPIKKVNNKLGINALNKIDLSNTKNWFEIKDGKMEIKPQKYNYEEVEFTIGGSHSFTQDMTYQALAKVPRSWLEKSKLGSIANSGLSFLESEAGKLGLDISQGEFIDLKIEIGGSFRSPTLKITPTGTDGSSVQDQVKDEIVKKIDSVKDTLTDKANKEIKKAKDSVNTVVNKAKDSITTVVNKTVDTVAAKVEKEIDKQVDTLKSKVNDKVEGKLDTLLDEKLKDVLGNKNEEEVDKIKDKVKDWNPFKKKKGGGD